MYCQFLVELSVSDNNLGCLPEDFGALVRLKTFEARKNKLLRLPDSVRRLTALTLLDVRENGIVETPVLPTTPALSQLFLGKCLLFSASRVVVPTSLHML